MAVIDFHCHIDLYKSPREVVAECVKRQIYVLSVTTTPSAFEGTIGLIPPGARIRTALGLHPALAADREGELRLFETLVARTRYVGEVGLDGSRHHRNTLATQLSVFRSILEICANAGGRIITIHSRLATRHVLDALSANERAGSFVLHWFLGTPRQVTRAAEMGCWFSVNRSMLATKRGIAAVQCMPRHRVLPETDGPFADTRRPTYPWESISVVPLLATLWNETELEVQERLMNAFKSVTAGFDRALQATSAG